MGDFKNRTINDLLTTVKEYKKQFKNLCIDIAKIKKVNDTEKACDENKKEGERRKERKLTDKLDEY